MLQIFMYSIRVCVCILHHDIICLSGTILELVYNDDNDDIEENTSAHMIYELTG